VLKSYRPSLLESVHVPCDSWVAINPPSPSNTSLTIKDSKLVESKLLLQLARHGDAGGTSTNNDNRVVCVGIVLVAVYSSYRFMNHTELKWEVKESKREGCERAPRASATTS
jgi:hypothetical protein